MCDVMKGGSEMVRNDYECPFTWLKGGFGGMIDLMLFGCKNLQS